MRAWVGVSRKEGDLWRSVGGNHRDTQCIREFHTVFGMDCMMIHPNGFTLTDYASVNDIIKAKAKQPLKYHCNVIENDL